MAKRALHIAAYDIREAGRLRRMLLILKEYATGGQKSVFECFLHPGERQELIARVRTELENEDRFMLVQLDPRSRIDAVGIAVKPADPGYYYIG